MALEVVQSACLMLKSQKALDRKRGAESLIALISDPDITRVLDSNSIHKDRGGDKLTWTNVFNDAREYFAKENEKLNATQGASTAKQFCFSVVDQVFHKGISNRPWIGWKNILSFVMEFLNIEPHATVYGNGLVSILQSFLTIELYVSVIDANSWIELIRLLFKLHRKSKIPMFMILQCINSCIQEGSNHPAVISVLRSEVVQFFENIFAERNKWRPYITDVLRGVTALSRSNAVEFRMILCKLGESVIPKILSSSSYTTEEENAVVETLLVQLQLHSPCNVDSKSPAFYSDDQMKWNECLKLIYSFCLDSIEDVATKKQSHYNKEVHVSEKLLTLAAKSTKLMFDGQSEHHSSSGDEDDPNPAKKAMRFRTFHNLLSEICGKMSPGESQIVWMSFLTSVLAQFPELVESTTHFSNLFHMGNQFLKSNYASRRELYEFLLCLLNTENYLIKKTTLKSRNKQWGNVWDITVRSLPTNESKTEAMGLLRRLLIEVQPPNVHALLLQYLPGCLSVSHSSLHLLAEYLSRCSLPLYMDPPASLGLDIVSTSCPRLSLLRWIMSWTCSQDKYQNQMASTVGHEALMATIMCSLLVRQTHNLIYVEQYSNRSMEQGIDKFEVSHEDYEKLILKCCFVYLESKNYEQNRTPDILNNCIDTEIQQKLSLIPAIPVRLVEALTDDYEKIPVFDQNHHDFMRKYSHLHSRISLYLNTINILEKYSIGSGEDNMAFRINLDKLFDKAFSKAVEIACDFMTKGKAKSPSQVQELVSILRNAIKCDYFVDTLKSSLAQRFPQQLQELLKKVYRSNMIRYIERAANNPGDTLMFGSVDILARYLCSGEDNGDVGECRQIELAALEGLGCLIDYGIICDHRIDLFTDILKDCMNETFHSYMPFIFEFSSELISRLIHIVDSGGMYSDIITLMTNLLQKMCRGYYQVPQCTAKLWELFSDITEVIANDSDVNKKNLMVLVGTLSGFMKTGTPYGSSIIVCQSGFRTLTKIAKNDPNLKWSVFCPKSGPESWVLNETYEFLNNPSHQIRLFAEDTIHSTYKFASPPVLDSQERFNGALSLDQYYDRISYFLQKTVFGNNLGSLSTDEIAEESHNRTSISLTCLARLIFAYPFIQKRTLFSLLHLVKEKVIDVNLANRALNYSSATASKTMCCHVSFLIQKWLSNQFSIGDFPYQFFGCDSLIGFYNLFKKEICVEFFLKNDMEGLGIFAKSVGLDSTKLIKECYGMLMARFVPGLAVYKYTNQCGKQDITQLQEIQRRFNTALGGKTQTESLMMTCLDDVLMQSVSLIFDPNIPSLWGCPQGALLPEPSSSFYDEGSIDTAIKFLKEVSSRKNISIIAYLALYSPRSIYDTLLTLIKRVHNAHDVLEKFWRLHHFAYFVNLLIQEPAPIFNTMKEYVCQFVVHGYLRLLKNETGKEVYSSYLRKSIVHLITKLVLNLTLSYKDEMKIHYYDVVKNLVAAVVLWGDELMECVKKSLDILLLRYNEDYSPCIKLLDPFPSGVADFEPYIEIYENKKYGSSGSEWTLHDELESCIEELKPHIDSCTKERLQFIRELLSTKKREFDKLVKSLDGKRFSDECNKDIVHLLVQTLLQIVKSQTSDSDVALEAARCLGEIGPIDLSVLVLPRVKDEDDITKHSSNNISKGVSKVLKILTEYLKADDIAVVQTAGEVLRSMCQMEECVSIITTDFAKSREEIILKPFVPTTNSGQGPPSIIKTVEKVLFNILENKLALNEMNEFVDYPSWITNLTCGLLGCFKEEESIVAKLLPVCQIKMEFCQQILPFVVYVMLYSGKMNPFVRRTVSSYFRNFFQKFVHHLSNQSETSGSFSSSIGTNNHISIYVNKLALRSLLGVVQFLRKYQAPQDKGSLRLTPWDNNFWLDVNYLELAKAAQYCGAFLTSILFTEIAVTELEMGSSNHMDESIDENESFYSQGASLVPRVIRGDTYEKLLLKAYTSIGEPDAVYGCGSARFSDVTMKICHFQQRQQYNRVLSACDGNAIDSNSSVETGVCSAFKDLGLYNSLWTYLQGLESQNNKVLSHDLAEIQYECGWRLSKWDLHCDKATYLKGGSFFQSSKSHGMLQRFVYESVQTGLDKDWVNHKQNLKRGYKNISKSLRHASIESSENLYGFLSQFQTMRLVEDFFQNENPDEKFLVKWKLHDRIPSSNFKFQEPILQLRGVLLYSYNQRSVRVNPMLETAYDDCMLELLGRARDCGRLELAEKLSGCIASGPVNERTIRKDLEIAKNHWARGEQDIARSILGKMIKKSPPDGCSLFPNMLLLYGEWLSESMNESPSVILEKYLSKSCDAFERRALTDQREIAKAHFVLAKYADTQYQNVAKYIKSDLYAQKVAQIEKAKTDISTISQGPADIDSRKTLLVLRKQSNMDEEELRTTREEMKKFLKLALQHYLKGLRATNDQDLLIFRAVALWLENAELGDSTFSKSVNEMVKSESLPTYKYVVVLHQLSARLNTNSNCVLMTEILRDILLKCAIQHPYHTLPVLLTQALLHKDQEVVKSKKQQIEDRVQAASTLVEILKKDKTLGSLVKKMETLWMALINLANYNDKSNSSSNRPIPSDAPIRSIVALDSVYVPTTSIPVSQSADYKGSVIGIKSFDPTYAFVGGINSPKRISCTGTNGLKFNMLLKGQDDLRQDAVMQQVFSVMNKLLQNQPLTKARRLHVCTYKVVPLSQRTGILEWCENTVTFGEYLASDRIGAHQKYRPNDYIPIECRRKMNEVKDCGDSDKKLGNFMSILEHFKPVFRHFFFENFKEAGVFLERRLAYTRSVATNSMVGYILGLGDRHVQNILVDQTTAELIHIDLGVAFEQGRILPCPETIPFRLTRDIVDGMGITGVEGVFRKSCEMTLEVLRNNSEIILTILEVLLYDPLYMWTLTADRMRKVQPAESSKQPSKKRNTTSNTNDTPSEDAPKERNNSAARVLIRLRQKLAGVEEGGSSGSALNVPGHVSLLIQRAMDPERLSKLFPGWQPYL